MSTPLVSYEISTDREDLSDAISLLADRETPFLDVVMNGGLAATNTRHEWVNTKLVGFKDQLNGSINSAVTTITVDGSYGGLPTKYVVGTIIKIDSELMRVTNVNSATSVDVTRGFNSTTAASHADNALVDIISKPKPEGFIPTESEHELGTKDYNISQIFYRYVSLSSTTQAIRVVGNENQMALQVQRKLKELMKEMERQAIRGVRYEDGSGDNRMFGGLDHYLTGTSVIDGQNAYLDYDVIDDAVFQLLNIGVTPNIILCSNDQKNRFNNLKIDRVKSAQAQSDKKINNLVEIYESEAGPLRLVRSNDVARDSLYILDTERIKVVPLQRQAVGMEPLAKVGLVDRVQVSGEYTMELRNPEAHIKINNLRV